MVLIRCRKCLLDKPREDYYPYCINQNSPTGLCKKCHKLAADKWRHENPAAAVQHVYNYRRKHPEKNKKMQQEVYERMKAKGTLPYQKHRKRPLKPKE